MPALEALLSAALERERLLGGVVETAALRRADTIKTALLRAVSHDLRSPLTAISAAGEALGLAHPVRGRARRDGGRDPGGDAAPLAAGRQPARPLAAGSRGRRAAPRVGLGRGADSQRGRRARRRPGGVLACRSIATCRSCASTPVQMERAFVNVLENARRHSGGHPVSVRARAVRSLGGARRAASATSGDGRGDAPRAAPAPPAGPRRPRDRAHRRPRARASRRRSSSASSNPSTAPARPGGEHRGSGLGLAIARGFTEANAGSLHVESLPGQGATFVFELPLSARRRGIRRRRAPSRSRRSGRLPPPQRAARAPLG